MYIIKERLKYEKLIPIFVIIVSIINIQIILGLTISDIHVETRLYQVTRRIDLVIENFFTLNVLLSIMGIIAGGVYFYYKKTSLILIKIWAILQLVIITLVVQVGDTTYLKPIIDFSQIWGLNLGFTIKTHSGLIFNVGINPVSFIFIFLVKLLSVSLSFGEKISLKAVKQDSFLQEYFPNKAKIIRRIKFSDDKIWTFVEFEEDKSLKYAIIRPIKSFQSLNYKKKGQLLLLRVVEDPLLLDKNTNIRKYTKGGVVAIT